MIGQGSNPFFLSLLRLFSAPHLPFLAALVATVLTRKKDDADFRFRCVPVHFRYRLPDMNEDWKLEFQKVWNRGVAAWKAGRRSAQKMFEPGDVAFLAGIGCTAQELFDFVDDSLRFDDLDFETALAVTEIRRKYFLEVMHGVPTGKVVPMRALPSKSEKVDGIAWLPRLIAKARIKLRGEMNPDLMYGCGGDRPFLRRHGMTLPEFLQLVWDRGEDDRAIVDTVKSAAAVAR